MKSDPSSYTVDVVAEALENVFVVQMVRFGQSNLCSYVKDWLLQELKGLLVFRRTEKSFDFF